MPSMNHVHTYERVGKRGEDKIWRCAHPDCTFTIHRELVLGKRSRCPCGNTFILDPGAMQRKAPRCMACRNTKQGRDHLAAQTMIEQMMGASADEPVDSEN